MRRVGKWSAVLTAAVALTVGVAGCGAVTQQGGNGGDGGTNTSNSTGSKAGSAQSQTIKVAMIPKLIGVPYFTGADDGAKQVASQLHINLTYNGPTTASASQQVSMINGYVAQGYNVLAVSANDPTSLAPALEAAMKKGVKVVTWDSDVLPAARNFFVDQATSQGIANALVKVVADHFKGQKIDVALLSSTPNATNQNQWIADMKKTIASTYPNLNIVTTQYSQEQPSTGLTAAENILKGYPNVKAIISPDSVGLPAAAEAVDKLNEKGKVFVTGLADPSVMKQAVNNGTVQQYVLWNVPKLGELTMYVARAVADGTMPTNGTFTCALGSFQVNDGVVLLGPPTIFDKASTDANNY